MPDWLLAHERDEENAMAERTHAPGNDTAWESEFVARVLTGDRAAFDRLVDAYTARVYTHVYRMTRNREEAEDVVQETFLRAYRSLARFDRMRPFRNWLYAIATNLALNALRARQRRGQFVALDFDVDAAEIETGHDDARATVMRGDMASRLAQAIGMLPPQPAALVHLHYMEGMSIREAAETLKMTEDAAKVALHRARKRLREWIGERE
jgi:RNA polymerase sigma-70 factor (ECF subfamily)